MYYQHLYHFGNLHYYDTIVKDLCAYMDTGVEYIKHTKVLRETNNVINILESVIKVSKEVCEEKSIEIDYTNLCSAILYNIRRYRYEGIDLYYLLNFAVCLYHTIDSDLHDHLIYPLKGTGHNELFEDLFRRLKHGEFAPSHICDDHELVDMREHIPIYYDVIMDIRTGFNFTFLQIALESLAYSDYKNEVIMYGA